MQTEKSSNGAGSIGQQQGNMVLESNAFFDGKVFDPQRIEEYLAQLP